jgi:O-antigen/teichoic acid export membrane protein
MNKRIIFKNTAWMSVGQFVGRGIGFLYYIFLARYLSVSQFGVWNWVLGLGYNFYPLADFGIQRYILKHLPREPERKEEYLHKLLPLRLVLAVGSVMISCLLALILGSPTKAGYMLIFGLALLPYNLIFLYTSLRNAFEEMHVYGLVNIGITLGYTLAGLIIMQLNLGLGWLFSSYFVGIIASFLILNSLVKESLISNWQWDTKLYKQILKESWVFGLFLVLAVFYIRISLILIGVLLGDYQAGIYGAASKFVEAGILFPQSIAIAFFPSFSKLFINDRKKLLKTYLQTLPVLLVIAIPFWAIMWFGGKDIIPVIYGKNYMPAVPVFQLMGVLMVLFFVNSLADNVIQNSNQVKRFLPLRLMNFLFALIVGIIIIPKLGVIGGVWTLIIGEIYGFVVNNWYVMKILNYEL